MLKIGELSELCHVSTKTLRYWDSVGILPADRVDDFTGYRYYHPEAVETVRRIRLYQDISFSLDEIRALLGGSPEMSAALMAEKRHELSMQNILLQGKLSQLETISREKERADEVPLSEFRDHRFFEDDPALPGRWELCGVLDIPEDQPADVPPTSDLPVLPPPAGIWPPPQIIFLPDGRPWWMFAWTRGMVLRIQQTFRTMLPCPYTLWEREGETCMALRLTGPGVAREGAWFLYRRTEHRALSELEGHTCVDDTDISLCPDPAVLGSWEAVDFVSDPDAFLPDRPVVPRAALWIMSIHFHPGNICTRRSSQEGHIREHCYPYTHLSGTPRGCILRSSDAVAEEYFIHCRDGQDYLFVQHKSGDYIYGGLAPSWYVFRRIFGSGKESTS